MGSTFFWIKFHNFSTFVAPPRLLICGEHCSHLVCLHVETNSPFFFHGRLSGKPELDPVWLQTSDSRRDFCQSWKATLRKWILDSCWHVDLWRKQILLATYRTQRNLDPQSFDSAGSDNPTRPDHSSWRAWGVWYLEVSLVLLKSCASCKLWDVA